MMFYHSARTSTRRMISRPQRGVDSGMATQVLPQQTVVYIRFPKRADQEKQADAKQRRFLAQHVFREVKQARNSIQKLSRRSTRD